jgi:16S rRNA (cytidine1402-2'-O)-methyltransferase
MSTLYLVATPIGNFEDITLRALRVLREAPLIAAEDTRVAKVLLQHHAPPGGVAPMPRITSYNEHNARAKRSALLRALDEGDLALVSDSGMPAISDPGHDLVVAAIDAGHEVVPVPGASAVLAAVAASGLASRRFHYLGFLPRQSGPRRRALVEAAASRDTLVVFESPHRMRATLQDALDALGDRRIAVCRELTKRYEEIWRGTISGALAHFASPRGEFTLVVEGGGAGQPVGPSVGQGRRIEEVVAEMRGAGVTSRDAMARLVRECGVSRREAYRVWHAS